MEIGGRRQIRVRSRKLLFLVPFRIGFRVTIIFTTVLPAPIASIDWTPPRGLFSMRLKL
jgi:hypothetical protein